MESGLICGAQGVATASAASSDVVVGSSLGFRLRQHKRRDAEPRRDRQTGNNKKVRSATLDRKKGVTGKY